MRSRFSGSASSSERVSLLFFALEWGWPQLSPGRASTLRESSRGTPATRTCRETEARWRFSAPSAKRRVAVHLCSADPVCPAETSVSLLLAFPSVPPLACHGPATALFSCAPLLDTG